MRRRLVQALDLAPLIIAACGAPDTPVTGDPGDPRASQTPGAPTADGVLTIAPGAVDGPPMQIADALAAASGEPVLVSGALFVDAAGEVRLCSMMAESFPPQCGGERLEVVGLDLSTIPDLEAANGVQWAEGVELTGTID